MTAEINLAILGSGIFVKEQHIPAVQKCRQLNLKAFYSRSHKSALSVAAALSEQPQLYSDDSEHGLDELLGRSDIHAVIIALPIVAQPAFIRRALQAGKHVLAEKPLAPNVRTGKELIEWYRSSIDSSKQNFSVAENFRFLPEYQAGARHVKQMGRILGFRIRMQTSVREDFKYYKTEWRKKPEYQGGFLLDGGVHFTSNLRTIIGHDARVVKLSAFTTLLQDHLPPVDTLDATLQLTNGATGTFSLSFGTTFTGSEYSVACEKGIVSVERDLVRVKPVDGEEFTEEVKLTAGSTPVAEEVATWAESILARRWDARQTPEEALADLEILEACLTSGEKGGAPVTLEHQL